MKYILKNKYKLFLFNSTKNINKLRLLQNKV